jgi:hypothetical protein
MIHFDEASHTYTDTETGKQLISVTTLLGKYKPKFDAIGNATRVAKREGVHVDFILEQWEETKNKACDYGTHIHKVMEDFLVDGKIEDEYKELYASYSSHEDVFKGYPKLHAEEKLYDTVNGIAGTGDLIYENSKSFKVGDFKTNKRFRYTNEYGEYMTGPVSHLTVCEFNSYALQLSLYAHMYEAISGKKCDGLVIFYKNPEKYEWSKIHVNYLKEEVKAIVADYNSPS